MFYSLACLTYIVVENRYLRTLENLGQKDHVTLLPWATSQGLRVLLYGLYTVIYYVRCVLASKSAQGWRDSMNYLLIAATGLMTAY